MFIVFNKSKICTYLVTLCTVFVLFAVASSTVNRTTNAIQTAGKPAKELPVYQVDMKDKKVSLTINCAWSADDIDNILETLKKENVKATFFMVGDWIDKFPEAVKKISDAGHDLGNHSNTHPHVNNLTFEKNVQQINACNEKIEKLTGKKCTLYRPPYGEYNDTVIKAAKSCNQVPIQWNIDTLDYTGLTGKEMVERINQKLAPGSIILMHNGTKYTMESLSLIIQSLKQKNYNIVPISGLILENNYIIDANGVQKAK